MRTNIALSVLVATGFTLEAQSLRAQTPLGAAFTYQGQMKDAGVPLNANVDLQFRLFPAAIGGTQTGGTQSYNNVAIVNGLFNLELDFGPVFSGDARWLQIAARNPAGSGTFTTLIPRQPLTATPYALHASAATALDAADGSPTGAVFVDNDGNVGIGTATPEAKVHIRGHSGEGIRIDGTAIGAVSGAYLSFGDAAGTPMGYVGDGGSGDTNVFLTSYVSDVALITPAGRVLTAKAGGNVGVGTTEPVGGLHVYAEPLTYGGTLTLEGITSTYIAFFPEGMAAGRKAWFGYGSAFTNELSLVNDAGGNINLFTYPGAATRVNVLEIAGADLAERFPASERLEPGMVVAIDPTQPGKLRLAREAYDRRVAGIVSGANNFTVGAVLGNLPGNEDAPPIALTGRVYAWCDARHGAIEPGDLLTTSDVPGYAMKAADQARAQGAVLGKAMTALDQGQNGLVLVLVNLQ